MNGKDTLEFIVQYGTQAERLALDTEKILPLTAWYETDTGNEYKWFGSWVPYPGAASGGVGSRISSNGDNLVIKNSQYSYRLTPRANPLIFGVGDSTFGYERITTPSAASCLYLGNGIAQLSFAVNQNLRSGDIIGVQGAADRAYNIPVGSPIISATGSGPYLYTYKLRDGYYPSITPDTASAQTFMIGTQRSSYTLLGNLRFLAGPCFDIVNCGIGGDTSTDIINRWAWDVAPYFPDEVILTFGINDIYKGMNITQSKANLKTIYNLSKYMNARLRIVAMPPQPTNRSNWTTATRDYAIALRKYMKLFARKYNCKFHDWSGVAAGNEVAQVFNDVNAIPSPGMINATGGDNIHPTNKLGYLLGKEIASDLIATYQSNNKYQVKNITDGGLPANPLFLNGSGGLAANCTTSILSGSPAITPSQIARTIASDGDTAGNWQRISVTCNAAGDSMRLRLEDLASKLLKGTSYLFMLQARIVSGAEICNNFSVKAIERTASDLSTDVEHWIQRPTGGQQPWPEPFSGFFFSTMTTRSNDAAPGAISNFQPEVQITSSAAGTIVFDVACFEFDPLIFT